MSVLAGIDLLSKYFYGKDEIGNVGKRFKGYYENYINKSNSEIIYQLRNSLLHSFGLYSYKIEKKTNRRIEFYFGLTAHGGNLITKRNETSYLIDIFTLWQEFEKSITLYYNDLKVNSDLKNNFNKMFPFYSITNIGK